VNRLRSPVFRTVAAALVVSKIVVAVAVLAVLSGQGQPADWASVRHVFTGWDAQSFISIAQNGYPSCITCASGHLIAFLPGMPFLIRATTRLGMDPVWGGLLVSLVAETVALTYIFALVKRERDTASAHFAVWMVALAPFGLFLSAVYTESVFIAAAAASLYYARAGNTRKSVIAAAVACATRLTGVALIPALIAEILLRKRRFTLEAAAPLVGLIPLAVFGAYVAGATHDAMAIFDVNRLDFDHSLAPPWSGLNVTWQLFTAATGENRFIWIREIVSGIGGFVVVGLCVVWTLRRRLAPALTLYCIGAWLMAVSISFWLSVGRYDLALFPAVIVLADLTKRFWPLQPALVAGSGGLMLWGSEIYATGHWLA
jgi:Dolichyl-phosphate-mannose-protein mannosyltransferase